MIRFSVISIGTLLVMLSLSGPVCAAIVFAKSCSQADVQTAVDSAQDGSTVLVPSGNCQWSQPVTVGKILYPPTGKILDSKNIVVKGSGVGKTNIANISSTTDTLFTVVTVTGKSFRLSGFTFSQPGGAIGSRATIEVFGTGKSTRIDHCKFDNIASFAIYIFDDQAGVIDHNDFSVPYSTIAIKVFHGSWDSYPGDTFGDGSWASPLNLGGSRAVFIEDNTFAYQYDGIAGHTHAWAVDASEGARYVFRYNTLKNTVITLHGSDSGNNRRGTFSFEIYGNTITRDAPVTFPNAISLRGGTGVIWGNTATGTWNKFAMASIYRRWTTDMNWAKGCNGEGTYDSNDGIVYDEIRTGVTGTHNGPNTTASKPDVYDSTKSWTTNQWTSYGVYNITTGISSYITSNTSTILNVYPTSAENNTRLSFKTGDTYKIMKPLICTDQVGRSTGVLLSSRPTPTPTGWTKQILEPVYVWNNTLNGGNGTLQADDTGLVDGVDFINGTVRPGYTPYTYPHPLNKKQPGTTILDAK